MPSKSERVMTMSERIQKLANIDKKTGAVTDLENAFMETRPETLTEAQLKDAMQHRSDFIEAAAHVVVNAQLPVMQKNADMSACTSTVPLYGRDTATYTTDRKAGLIISVTEHSTNPKASTLKELSSTIRQAFLEESDEDKEKKAA